MDKLDRIQKLHRIFKSHRFPVTKKQLAEKLDCSERNVQRVIDNLKIIDAPVIYDSSQRGWRYDEDPDNLYELPGLWLTCDELQSLSLLLSLLEHLGQGLLGDELAVIEDEINALLKAREISPSAFANHIKILPVGHRQLSSNFFSSVSEALLKKRRLQVQYTSYSREQSQRELSPQTLIHYRDNWYLDAWCHKRQALRTFSIARMTGVEVLKARADTVDKAQLNAHFSTSYGIFAGKAKSTARLRFSPEIAREIALQQWHPDQIGEWDGADFILHIPYSDDRELLQDLLRNTPHVYVEAPVKLRKKLQNKLQQGLERQLSKGLGWL